MNQYEDTSNGASGFIPCSELPDIALFFSKLDKQAKYHILLVLDAGREKVVRLDNLFNDPEFARQMSELNLTSFTPVEGELENVFLGGRPRERIRGAFLISSDDNSTQKTGKYLIEGYYQNSSYSAD